MATHLTKFPADHDPSLVTTSSSTSSSSSSPPPAKIEDRENPTTSSAAYTGTCCYNSLKLSPPFDSAMALTVLVLLIALFFMGFFSIYIRRFADESSVDPTRRRGRRRRFGSASTASYLARSKNNGLDPKKVESLPVHAYEGGGAKQGIDCAICLAEFQEREWVKEIPYCRHVFHSDCIDKWLSSHVTCPLCRTAKLFAGDEAEEKEEGGLGVGEVQGGDGGGEVRIVVEDERDTWNENRGETEVGSIGGSGSTSASTCSRSGERERLRRSLSF